MRRAELGAVHFEDRVRAASRTHIFFPQSRLDGGLEFGRSPVFDHHSFVQPGLMALPLSRAYLLSLLKRLSCDVT